MLKKSNKIMLYLLRRAIRFRFVQVWLNHLATVYKLTRSESASTADWDIPEVSLIEPRACLNSDQPRLNLLVPAISQKHAFGGIETALQAFDRLREHFGSARIIVTDETIPEPKGGAYYSDWQIVQLRHESPDCDHIVAAGDRWGQTLPIHAKDYFMATAWWTAHSAHALLDWQQRHYPAKQRRCLLYFIQDFEPGFYPWSSRYVLAQATYSRKQETLAAINSDWLRDFLHQQGHAFYREYVHHPRLHPTLAVAKQKHCLFAKERQILVYGRPGTERNAFPIIVAALKLWVQRYPEAQNWKILSAGEVFLPIDLGRGCQLQSQGKVSIEEYASLLSETAVGLSLMISPHPSYPPLEMAAFGVRVVTNQFANKDLSKVSSFLTTITYPDPDKLANQLLELCRAFDGLAVEHRSIDPLKIDWIGDFLEPDAEAWAWTSKAAQDLLAT